MATYSNPHWLLCHIRNSFISTDNTGMCETVMVSDDLPKHYMRKFQANCLTRSMQLHKKRQEVMNMINQIQQNQQQLRKKQRELKQEQQKIQQQKQQHQHIQQQQQQIQELQKEIEELQPQIDNLQQQILQILQQEEKRNCDPNLKEVDFICYPDLDESDDEDVDLTAQSFDIQMYPEIGAHRFRSNTAQKLEKMDIARRKAAKTKCVNYDDEIMQPERHDFFVRKSVGLQEQQTDVVKSKLTLQLENSPKQLQNKFQEFAKFDGTSQTGVQTKRINVFLSMLSEKERNYPIKICVLSHAKISDVIGLVCYKATIEFPHLCLKSIRHYGLYMTEDNDDLEDFPPLDHREPCSKFGFSHLTLAEKRHLATDIRIDNGQSGVSTKSMTSEEEKAKLAAMALHSLNCSGVGADGFHSPEDKDDFESGNNLSGIEGRVDDLEQRILSQDDMLEAPVYRSYNLNIIDKKFFKTEVSLGISGERIEIDQQKNAKFWTKQRAVTYPIDAVAHCEIVEKRTMKAVLRIWLKTSSSISSSTFSDNKTSHSVPAHSPSSPGHYPHFFSPFNFLNTSSTSSSSHHIRFKHYDFETTVPMAEQIYKKLSCILDMCSSDVRREFLQIKQRKLEKSQAKKHLKL